MDTNQYAVIEFSDGIQLVPLSWVMEDKKHCRWPNYTKINQFNQSVRYREPASESWSLHPIKRIMAKTSEYIVYMIKISEIYIYTNDYYISSITVNYDKGLDKLKAAEILSDLNTEDENENKKSRHTRAKIVYSSDNDDEAHSSADCKVNQYPSVPKKQPFYVRSSQKCNKTNNEGIVNITTIFTHIDWNED